MEHIRTRPLPFLQILFPALAMLLVMAPLAAARPTAMKIFPKETLGFFRITHARETFDKIKESSMGRMLNDPQIKPLVDSLYASAESAYDEVTQKEKIDLSLNEIWQIPQGEIAAGLIGRPQGKPTFAILMDLGDESTAAHKLLDLILNQMEKEGCARSVETMAELEVTVVRVNEDEIEAVVFIERENTLLVVADILLAKQMLALWDAAESGEPVTAAETSMTTSTANESSAETEETPEESAEKSAGETAEEIVEPYWMESLAENKKFVSTMEPCRDKKDDPPQIIFYADPIEIFRNFARGETGMAIALAMLPSLGLDGIQAIGGSNTYSTEKYDGITHMHLLLDNPRTGILAMLNLRNGDTTPEPWVPDSVETYMTGHWDVPMTYEKLIALYDQFQFKGAFEQNVERHINEETKLDFRQDIIGQLAGRFTVLLGFPKPARLRPRSMLLAVEVQDKDAALATIEKLIALEPEEFEERTFGGVKYWLPADLIQRFKDQGLPEEEAPMMPCWGIIENYAMVANSVQLLESTIAARDGTEGRLADALDYKLIASRIRRQSNDPGIVLFNRPEETLRYVYDLATSEKNREQLRNLAENNEALAILNRALEENPLPPFEVIAKYLAPSGGLVTDTETGFHFLSFTLRRE
ncbi:MAG: hypothetical protein JW829_11570 [Pirellulales bacterium]|nr:hypothetical protein [Pirellulales bacterium]